MVSIINYVRCSNMVLFNIMMLVLLVGQASDNDTDEPIMPPDDNIIPISNVLVNSKRNSGPLILQGIGNRRETLETIRSSHEKEGGPDMAFTVRATSDSNTIA